MQRRAFLKQSVIAAAAFAGGGILAGCGVGNTAGGAGAGSTAVTGSGTGGHSGAKLNFKLGYLPLTDHMTIIGHGQTQFQHAHVEPVKFASWAELSEALKAGVVQGAFALTPIGISLRQKGVPIKAVFLGHRNGSALTAKNSPDIAQVEDFIGKTIAIPSRFSTHNILIRKLLAEKGIQADRDVKLIDMAPPEMVNALSTGRVGGFIVAEPFGAQAEKQGVGKVLTLSKDIWPDHICCAVNVQEEVIAQHPEAVEELVAALTKAAAFIEGNPKEAAALSVKYLGQKAEIIEHVLTQPKGRVTFTDLTPNMADFTATQDYMIQFGITQERIDLQQYIDDRFARKAKA
ncbi:ABC transporter substrate-binding protein [Heliobacterium undosum]|uniref:ABC transporter substrate-binding protein n=2 Tax=Heliomicrobium undosum TaxID=121734 RepID=A0A845KYX7_9FIRM|nr:ABC transporter substrate-binding protein [Heliomicrobium undosum]